MYFCYSTTWWLVDSGHQSSFFIMYQVCRICGQEISDMLRRYDMLQYRVHSDRKKEDEVLKT